MFEGADAFSMYWQPLFKGVGRGQLELAHLGAKQGQAYMQWSRNVMLQPGPVGFMAASAQFWQSVSDQYADTGRKMASAVTQATQNAVPFELLTLPVKHNRDTLVIEPAESDHRQVA